MNQSHSQKAIPATSKKNWISGIAWFIAILLWGFVLTLGWQRWQTASNTPVPAKPNPTRKVEASQQQANLQNLPKIASPTGLDAVQRAVDLFTNIPNRPRQEIVEYLVVPGDSVFSIAYQFKVSPETVLWSNYDVLKDNPHAVTEGMALKIPPTEGVYYRWKEGDTLEKVAETFRTDAAKIIAWSGNKIDLTDPKIKPGTWVMLPDGQREFQQWIVPVMPRGAAGVSSGVYGGGACPGGYEGLYGNGAFIWPTINRTISGNDYWSGHLAIDIGSALGEPISAADSGVIVFAGWATGGYGNTIAIDHGNGYQTLYAHLNSVIVSCGQSVRQGQVIGYGGSTGNSTGPHLHFEIRYQGGFVNPWYVLPAP